MKNIISYILASAICCCCVHTFAQKKEITNKKQLSQIEFVQDSAQTFNNFCVKNNVINNIKHSKYPLEIRWYSEQTKERGEVYIIQSNKEHTKFTSLLYLTIEGTIDGFKVVKKITPRVNVITKETTKIMPVSFNDVCDTLLRNNIFKINANSQKSDFKDKSNGEFYTHSLGSIVIDVKLAQKFRNIRYNYNLNSIDTVQNRKENIFNTINYLRSFKKK